MTGSSAAARSRGRAREAYDGLLHLITSIGDRVRRRGKAAPTAPTWTDPLDPSVSEPPELTAEEVMSILDARARRELDMSGEEFLARMDRGDLPEHPAVAELMILAGARPG